MGIVPGVGATVDPSVGQSIPVVYHGGQVMDTGTVTVHTIFWAPAGYAYDGSPGGATLGYVPLIEQFFTDVAHDSGTQSNIFSTLYQYGDNSGPGRYSIAYSPATSAILDTDPYPAATKQCPSPAGIGTCLTDAELTAEIDHVIQAHDPAGYGLHDLWEVFLPPGVDECSAIAVCGTSSFAGYHSLADAGHGMFIYAVVIDSLIEAPPIGGADPQGNPEAETAIDTAAHETIEGITNPEGNGWMDPNGFEAGDKCESGPQVGTPLGYAPNGAPYDQLINGHQYEIQEIWSDAAKGCVQRSAVTTNALPLPRIALRQFSPLISGNIGYPKAHVAVRIALLRGGGIVAAAAGVTRANGAWGPLALMGPHGALHGLGDDRDELLVGYGPHGPQPDVIATGAGGNPFTESGFTNWLDLDTGFALAPGALALAPCGQIGVLTVTVDGVASDAPVPRCSTELDASVVRLPHVTGSSRVLLTSEDNRAVTAYAPNGALVSMTVALGEPGSVAAVAGGSKVPFPDTGIPACTADLRTGEVSCTGLVPRAAYRVVRGRGHATRSGRADGRGVVHVAGFPGPQPLAGGDQLTLRNAAGRALTTLHVAHLRIAIDGEESVIASGTCEPGDYWGTPLTSEPSSAAIGQPGAAGLGSICPANGKAAGLPTAPVAQVDDRSGGVTITSVPSLQGEAPADDATVYGRFTALAQTGVTGPHGGTVPVAAAVSLSISPAGSHAVAWHAVNVAVSGGVAVRGLASGVYDATWVVRDSNGDTRTVKTTFVQAG